MTTRDRLHGCLIGLATGDAVGTTVEFKPRGTFTPLTDMVGGGPFRLPAGAWTDDTSMALCLATSLVETGRFDPQDQMERYWRWFTEGYLSSTNRCFDIGNTIRDALTNWRSTGNPYSGSTDPYAAGNGCLMRLAPVVMFYADDSATAIQHAQDSARTTHGAVECLDCTRLFANLLIKALSGESKTDILFGSLLPQVLPLAPKVQAIADGGYRDKTAAQIKGSGYVVNSLEAALWSFWTTDDFRSAVLCAANLGDDADTTAAIVGQLAGAFYGVNAIPSAWRATLVKGDEISALADDLHCSSPIERDDRFTW